MRWRRGHLGAFLAAIWVALAGCRAADPCLTDAKRIATGWAPEEQLFRGDRSWLGGDAAYSVDLGQGRILWLFGDTFVSPNASGSRSGAPFARNTIAIQHGYDPSSATIDFHYAREADGTPSAFFASDEPNTWLWPGPGARLGDVLFVFLARIKADGSGLFGFVADLPMAVVIDNPDDDPDAWHVVPVSVPVNSWGVFLGTGGTLVEDGYLHVLSTVEPGNHDMFAARWPVESAAMGMLDDPEWATGAGVWTPQSAVKGAPMRLFPQGHTELSVHFDAGTKQYVEIQATGFPGDIMMRTAPALTGPWSEARAVYHPPELSCANVITYAGKAHPELAGASLGGRVAVSYASNSSDFGAQVRDTSLYFPRFVRLDVAAGIAGP